MADPGSPGPGSVPGPGGVLDEPATVKALVARCAAVHCGAVPEAEALARIGLDRAALLGE
jgi:hypothetical protein